MVALLPPYTFMISFKRKRLNKKRFENSKGHHYEALKYTIIGQKRSKTDLFL